MDEDDDRESSSSSSSVTKLTCLVIGGGIGAVLALLFAPRPGHELRSDIGDMVRERVRNRSWRELERDDDLFIDPPSSQTGAADAADDLGGDETKGDYD